jgi:Ca2+-binding RTX toxin-like protein
VINGVSAFDQSGWSVSSAGDVNGDGFDDLIIGAPFDDPNADRAGSSFVVFGGNFTGSATQVGSTGDDTLTGTVGSDVLIAGTGADTLVGSGGADILRGGAGDDILAISDTNFTKIEGGSGLDTLRLDGAGMFLDFRTIADNAITEIEIIDLNGQGNSVSLDVLEVLRLSDSSNTVRILGTNADQVTLDTLSWAGGTTVTDSEGTFNVYSNGQAILQIQTDIKLTGSAIELSEIETDNDMRGFVINGVSAGDHSGYSVSSAGDVNGDGFDDIIIGAKYVGAAYSFHGASYVIFGSSAGAAVELSEW